MATMALPCNRLLEYAIYIYCGETENICLVLKLGLHPSTLAHLSNSSSNLDVNPSVASGS
jgi:hypothetical protein